MFYARIDSIETTRVHATMLPQDVKQPMSTLEPADALCARMVTNFGLPRNMVIAIVLVLAEKA